MREKILIAVVAIGHRVREEVNKGKTIDKQ